jgi:hypothetical protein
MGRIVEGGLGIVPLAFCDAQGALPKPPQVCRIQGGNSKLIFGTGFESGAVEESIFLVTGCI